MSLTDLDQALLVRLDEYLTERDSALVAHLNQVTRHLQEDARERTRLVAQVTALARLAEQLGTDLQTTPRRSRP